MNKFINHSSYPTDELRKLIKFAGQHIDTARTAVIMEDKKFQGWHGTAYPEVWQVPMKYLRQGLPDNTEYFINLRLAPPGVLCLPLTGQYRKRAPHYTAFTWQEAFIHLAAHEFKHIEEFREGLDCSEVRCEYFATRMVKEFRTSVCYHAPIKGNQRSAA